SHARGSIRRPPSSAPGPGTAAAQAVGCAWRRAAARGRPGRHGGSGNERGADGADGAGDARPGEAAAGDAVWDLVNPGHGPGVGLPEFLEPRGMAPGSVYPSFLNPGHGPGVGLPEFLEPRAWPGGRSTRRIGYEQGWPQELRAVCACHLAYESARA